MLHFVLIFVVIVLHDIIIIIISFFQSVVPFI